MVALVAAPARASAAEAHETGHDVHVRVDAAGRAVVDHAITVRVAAGSYHGFELAGLERDAAIDGDGGATAEDGRAIPTVAAVSDAAGKGRVARIDVADPKGLKRGIYVFRVKYAVDLVAGRAIARDGALYRVSWTSSPPAEGLDGARVVFELPAAETEPRAVRAGGGPADPLGDGILSTLRRGPERDELEIVRPHVSRGESVTWSVRADPKAFGAITAPELRAPPPPPKPPAPPRHDLRIAAFIALGLLFASLVAAKSRAVERAARALCLEPRPLLPASRVPLRVRAALAGAAFAGGAALEGAGSPVLGAIAIAAAMIAATHLAPRAPSSARGPGSWLTLRAGEAYAPAARAIDPLDGTTALGAAAIAAAALVLVMAASVLARIEPEAPYLVALSAAALVPVFFTGTRRALPPHPARAPVPLLRALDAKLRRETWLRASPWARVPTGATEADELRLLVLPRASMPGLAGIEVGVAWRPAGAGFWGAPEILVRVHDATAAAAKLTTLAPGSRPVTGRRPEERVVRIEPSIPTLRGVLDVVVPLARELVDRRVAAGVAGLAWPGDERRAPPKQLALAQACP